MENKKAQVIDSAVHCHKASRGWGLPQNLDKQAYQDVAVRMLVADLGHKVSRIPGKVADCRSTDGAVACCFATVGIEEEDAAAEREAETAKAKA